MAQVIKSKNKAVLLLSGGLDSSVAGILALKKYNIIKAITFDYGQKAVKKEINAAKKFCKRRKIKHKTIKLDWYKKLVSKINKKTIPNITDINKLKKSDAIKTAKAVWFPQRNLLFISIAAAISETNKAKAIIAGLNIEEGSTFPDNSNKFIKSLNDTLNKSSFFKTELINPCAKWDKTTILKIGLKNGLNLDEIWSCYKGFKNMCNKCESCQRLNRAKLSLRGAKRRSNL